LVNTPYANMRGWEGFWKCLAYKYRGYWTYNKNSSAGGQSFKMQIWS